MNIKHLLTVFLCSSALFHLSDSVAQNNSNVIFETQAIVQVEYDGIFIDAPISADLNVMIVNIVGPDGAVVFNQRSYGSVVSFILDGSLPDGAYRFEVISVIGSQGQSLSGPESGQQHIRKVGRFKIEGNTILDPNSDDIISDDSISGNNDSSWPVRLAGVALDWLISDASAANSGVAAHGNTCVGDTSCDTGSMPTSNTGGGGFVDLTVQEDDGTDTDFMMSNTEGTMLFNLDNGLFTIFNDVAETVMMQLDLAAVNTLVADAQGDLMLAGGSVFIDKSKSKMIVGGTVEQNSIINFELHGGTPQFMMYDPGTDNSFAVELASNSVNFLGKATGSTWRGVFRYDITAPTSSLIIDSFGNIGVGTIAPAASVNVVRSDGTAQVLVQENAAPATRTLFHLKNAGRTHFKIENTDAGAEWVFTNAGNSFFISLQGTGGPEFKILNNGNAVLAGSLTQNSDINAKTAITEIDSGDILKLVSELPVTKWEYKDARGEAHIGPMAQDFYAAFGLGKSETGISTIDTAGVALAAIKALNEANISLTQQNSDLLGRLEKLERQQTDMQAVMAAFIEAQQTVPVLTKTAFN